jgi:hypothetical protein
MKYVRDTLHGFGERPHYEPSELDSLFERLVIEFLSKKQGTVQFPFATDDLICLVERDVADLDQFANLTRYGEGVEGVTEFVAGSKPNVAISEHVHRYENRLRTTLSHEYGHVHLHAYLFVLEPRQLTLGSNRKPNAIYCLRESILPIAKYDWMEWQAGYASGAVLMPKSYLTKVVSEVHQHMSIYGPVTPQSQQGNALVGAVVDAFGVSRDAATVRLKQLGFLGTKQAMRSLFG